MSKVLKHFFGAKYYRVIQMSKKSDKKRKFSVPVPLGDVFDAQDAVNKYGTYNIQPTADTENLFPQISHGLPKQKPDGRRRISDK